MLVPVEALISQRLASAVQVEALPVSGHARFNNLDQFGAFHTTTTAPTSSSTCNLVEDRDNHTKRR